MHAADVLGWVGAGALLLAYALVTRDPAQAAGRRYLALDLAGSAGLAASAAVHAAWPSTVLNLLWLVLGLGTLTRRRHGTSTDRDPHSARPG